MSYSPSVFFLDPDHRFVQSCTEYFQTAGIEVFSYERPVDFLEDVHQKPVGCLITELFLNGMTAIDLCARLREREWSVPVLILTSFGNVAQCSRAFRAGATDFIEKPIAREALWSRVSEELQHCRHRYHEWMSKQSVAERVNRLTDREIDVARALVSGLSMKEIAGEFGTSFQSVARHRQRILTKLHVENDVALANLLRSHSWPVMNSTLRFDTAMVSVHD